MCPGEVGEHVRPLADDVAGTPAAAGGTRGCAAGRGRCGDVRVAPAVAHVGHGLGMPGPRSSRSPDALLGGLLRLPRPQHRRGAGSVHGAAPRPSSVRPSRGADVDTVDGRWPLSTPPVQGGRPRRRPYGVRPGPAVSRYRAGLWGAEMTGDIAHPLDVTVALLGDTEEAFLGLLPSDGGRHGRPSGAGRRGAPVGFPPPTGRSTPAAGAAGGGPAPCRGGVGGVGGAGLSRRRLGAWSSWPSSVALAGAGGASLVACGSRVVSGSGVRVGLCVAFVFVAISRSYGGRLARWGGF